MIFFKLCKTCLIIKTLNFYFLQIDYITNIEICQYIIYINFHQAVNFVTKVGAICHTMAVELGTKLGQMPLAVCLARDFQQKRE